MLRSSLLSSLALFLAAFTVQASDNLSFFKNYFVTGDYVVSGVGLRGTGVNGIATGNISVNAVPLDADLVAAFLYWESVEAQDGQGSKGQFRGYNIVGKPLGNRVGPCWSSGGSTGASNGGAQLRVYRTDVLRYFPATNGKRIANGTFSVSLPDSGSGNKTPFTEGASLVMVYRSAGLPLRSVVLYDGAYSTTHATDTFNLTIQGFYQASTLNRSASITYIVGNGQQSFGERLLFNGTVLNGTNAFPGALGGSWDNPTFPVSSLVAGDSGSATTSVDHAGLTSSNCLSWGAVVFSTTVQDTDGDGLLDTWEKNGFTDITDGTFVNLPAMGANPNVKDLFIEIDYMTGADGHSHKPKQAALDMITTAFQKAPGGPVNVHFDVGQGTPFDGGGEAIPEAASTLYPGYSGVVGWKSGFHAFKAVHFRHDRKDIFHYVLFAHALGLPVNPATTPATLRTTSGIADLPGGDVLITLGLWRSDNPADDQVGSVLQQAGTLMHELGHNQLLRHGGDTNTPGCKPNYESVMNYLFQVRGLQTSPGGVPVVDYSRETLPSVGESMLNESSGLGTMAYLNRWYANPSYLDQHLNTMLGSRPATHHCDGTPVGVSESPLVRVEGNALSGAIDWNNDGVIGSGFIAPLDVNFSGSLDASLTGFSDWPATDLRQLGARRNAYGLSGDIASGDIASGDIASGDIASGDIASGDIASGDIASGDIASGVMTQLDIDFETAASVVDPPANLTATLVKKYVVLNWSGPAFGQIRQYGIYRAVNAISPTNLPTLIGTVSGTPPLVTFTDVNVKTNTTYTYFVTAVDIKKTQSGASNQVTIRP